MKRYMAVALLLVILCTQLTGCGLWMDGEYVSVEPHEQERAANNRAVSEVSTYMQMRNALVAWIENGTQSGVLNISRFTSGSVRSCMDTAIRYAMNSNPMGAYTVSSINYELGNSNEMEVVSVKIDYRYDRSHILRIQKTDGMESALQVIEDALINVSPVVAVRIPQYTEMNFSLWVQNYAERHSDVIMEVPSVKESVYPQQGVERIVELEFTYQTSRDTLKQMQKDVEPVFTAAELYVKNASQVREKYSQLYGFLMERFDYTVETSSITPTYSLLNRGVGDDKAFAKVYAIMCDRAGLECYVVSGTKDQQPWTWNLINFRGIYYHLDLLQCNENGAFRPQLVSEMEGYEWDNSSYPS